MLSRLEVLSWLDSDKFKSCRASQGRAEEAKHMWTVKGQNVFCGSFPAVATSPFAGITAQGCEGGRKSKPVKMQQCHEESLTLVAVGTQNRAL